VRSRSPNAALTGLAAKGVAHAAARVDRNPRRVDRDGIAGLSPGSIIQMLVVRNELTIRGKIRARRRRISAKLMRA
jgi:hypothetical protein